MSDPTSGRLLVNLFVVGDSRSSQVQIDALKHIFTTNNYPLDGIIVIDLLEEPKLAAEHDILAIPTLIRKSPSPPLRIIGDLAKDSSRIWDLLDS